MAKYYQGYDIKYSLYLHFWKYFGSLSMLQNVNKKQNYHVTTVYNNCYWQTKNCYFLYTTKDKKFLQYLDLFLSFWCKDNSTSSKKIFLSPVVVVCGNHLFCTYKSSAYSSQPEILPKKCFSFIITFVKIHLSHTLFLLCRQTTL